MYYQLGSIVFEGTLAIQSAEISGAANLAEVATVSGRPIIQKQPGAPLARRTLAFQLSEALGHDPTGKYSLLETWRDEGRILPLTNGEGVSLGTYLIASLSESTLIAGLDGRRLLTQVSVELIEYVDRSPGVTAKRQAVDAGFATNPAKVIPVLATVQGKTVASLTSASALEAQRQCLDSVADVRKSVSAPTQKDSLFQQASAKMRQATDNIDAAIAAIEETATIAATAPALLAQMETIQASAAVFVTRLAEGDLTNALTQGTLLTSAFSGLGNALRPLNLAIITRQI